MAEVSASGSARPPAPPGAVTGDVLRAAWVYVPPTTRKAHIRRWVTLLLLVAVLTAGAWLVYSHDPVRAGFFPPCFFYKWTGYYCAGCGSTRATHQLLHGRVWAAFRYNPLLLLTLPFFAYEFSRFAVRTVRPRPIVWRAVHPLWIWGPAIVIMTFWVVRNLPFRPFVWLAPTDVSAARHSSHTPGQSDAR